MNFVLTLTIVFVLLAAGVGVTIFVIRRRRRNLVESLKMKLFSLQFSRKHKEGTDLMKEIMKSEQFFSSFSKFSKPVVFEAAVHQVGEEIHFYAAVPAGLAKSFISQVHSIWTDVLVEEVGDYNMFHHAGFTVGGYLSQKEDYAIPIRTYKEAEVDTFRPVLGGLSEVDEIGEGGAIQVVVKAASSSHRKRIKKMLGDLKKGKSLKDSGRGTFLDDLWKAVAGENKKEKKKQEEDREVNETLVEAVQKKIQKPLFEVNVRVMASGPSQLQANSIFDGVSAGFSQFASPGRNDLSLRKPRNPKKIVHNFVFRNFSGGGEERLVLNSEELASIFHFPTAFTEIPRVKHLKSVELPPPLHLPKRGTLLGENVYRGKKREIYISDDDRRSHLHVVGQRGTGKTNFLIHLANQDIKKGKGVAFLDPNGDAIPHIMGLVPEKRYEDVILFEPTSLDCPMGLNMLEYSFEKPEQKTFIVDEMVKILDKLYGLRTTGGPMFEQYIKNALLLLMEDAPNEPATLIEVPRVFSDSEYRNRKLNRISNAAVVNFWRREAEKAGGEAALSNIAPYITSEFNNFITNDYMRVIVGQRESAFDFRKVMDEGKILLVNLSKGKIGSLNAGLLGMIIVGKILMVALERIDIPEEKRRDFNLFIDEFQDLATDSILSIFAETKRYRLNLVAAHQSIAQLPGDIRDTVFGNVTSLFAFRVGARDAEVLERQFEPHLAAEDLMNIDNFNMYAKLLVRGQVTNPFKIRTFLAPLPDPVRREQLGSLVKWKYGRSRQEVEEEIAERLST